MAALLLKQQGHDVVGVFMKNWSQDLPGFKCPWKQDYLAAKRTAIYLDIPFKVFDFESEYRHKVVDYMISSFKEGMTPNPDIMCNQEIKFKLFLDASKEAGADMIATVTMHLPSMVSFLSLKIKKDQTYFLYRISEQALRSTIFPLGSLTKPEVRNLASDHGLPSAGAKRAWVSAS